MAFLLTNLAKISTKCILFTNDIKIVKKSLNGLAATSAPRNPLFFAIGVEITLEGWPPVWSKWWVGIRDILGEVPQNFGWCVVLSDPRKSCFIAFLRRNWGGVFYGTKFFSKNRSKIRYIFGNFFEKSMFYASKWSQTVRFWRILMKSPIKLHTGCFSKILKIWPPNPPPNSLFIAFLRRKFWPSVLFYRSKKPILCCWDPP